MCAAGLPVDEKELKTRVGRTLQSGQPGGFGSFFFALPGHCALPGPRRTTRNTTVTERTLPAGLHPDTLAVREAVERSQWGEHSEALYLTSSFVQPDAATAARRFANEEPGYTYSRTSNPTVSSFEP